MTDINYRRKNRKPVNQRYGEYDYNNGYASPDNKGGTEMIDKELEKAKSEGFGGIVGFTSSGSQRIGRTDYLDKSMHSWGRKSKLADKVIGAGIGNDFTNGHRGMAKAVKGAKKFVRSRIRFAENSATNKLAQIKIEYDSQD